MPISDSYLQMLAMGAIVGGGTSYFSGADSAWAAPFVGLELSSTPEDFLYKQAMINRFEAENDPWAGLTWWEKWQIIQSTNDSIGIPRGAINEYPFPRESDWETKPVGKPSAQVPDKSIFESVKDAIKKRQEKVRAQKGETTPEAPEGFFHKISGGLIDTATPNIIIIIVGILLLGVAAYSIVGKANITIGGK